MTELKKYPWRERMQPARFRDAEFHVELDGQASGRRVVVHEYPKRNKPYAEDMGRRAVRHIVDGYIIMSPTEPDYIPARDALIDALEADGPGWLVHPLLPAMLVMCEGYTVNESRERGGFCKFDMTFVEAGDTGGPTVEENTQVQAVQQAQQVEQQAVQSLDETLKQSSNLTNKVGGGAGGGASNIWPVQ